MQWDNMNLPRDGETRQAIRDQLIDEYNIAGYKASQRHGRSINCEKGNHSKWDKSLAQTIGCKNTGKQCLCRCHDLNHLG